MLKAGARTVGDLWASVVTGGMPRGTRAVMGTAGLGLAAPTLIAQPAAVPKLCQNPIYLAEKGIDFERKQNPRKRVSAWEEKG